MPDGSGHFPYLSVSPFAQRDFNPGGGNILAKADRWKSWRDGGLAIEKSCLCGLRFLPLNHYSFLKPIDGFDGRSSFNLDEIRSDVFEFWICQTMVNFGVVR